jgi:hypothetical protein
MESRRASRFSSLMTSWSVRATISWRISLEAATLTRLSEAAAMARSEAMSCSSMVLEMASMEAMYLPDFIDFESFSTVAGRPAVAPSARAADDAEDAISRFLPTFQSLGRAGAVLSVENKVHWARSTWQRPSHRTVA